MGIGSSNFPTDKSIVVVGAGYGGVALGMELMKGAADFTIISPSDIFHHNIGAVRAVVEPGFSNKILIPLEKTFDKHFKRGKVVSVNSEEKKVTLESGDELSYDILVVATGCQESLPIKLVGTTRDEAMEMYQKEVEKIKEAPRVAIIGGGATGVEIAGEVAYKYPEKEVTLVHNLDILVTKDLTDKNQQFIQSTLKEMKVKVVLGEKVTNLDEQPEEGPYTLTTDKETTIEVDHFLKCVGIRVSTEAYENGLADSMDENGRLKVNEFLHVAGHEETIYAVGDCTNVQEAKTAYQAGEQAKVVAKTLRSVLSGGKPSVYKAGAGPLKIGVTLGPTKAAGELKNGMIMPMFLMLHLKARDMITGKFWKDLGQTVPT